MATQMQRKGFFWREIAWPPASCESETSKQSARQNGNRKTFLYLPCLSIKLRFIFHVHKFGIKKETEIEKVGDRQAKLNEKKRPRAKNKYLSWFRRCVGRLQRRLLYVRKKILSPEVWEKNSYPNQTTHTSLKSHMVGPLN